MEGFGRHLGKPDASGFSYVRMALLPTQRTQRQPVRVLLPVAPWLLRTTYVLDLAVALTLRLELAVRVAGSPGRLAGDNVFAVDFAPLVPGRVQGGMWVDAAAPQALQRYRTGE